MINPLSGQEDHNQNTKGLFTADLQARSQQRIGASTQEAEQTLRKKTCTWPTPQNCLLSKTLECKWSLRCVGFDVFCCLSNLGSGQKTMRWLAGIHPDSISCKSGHRRWRSKRECTLDKFNSSQKRRITFQEWPSRNTVHWIRITFTASSSLPIRWTVFLEGHSWKIIAFFLKIEVSDWNSSPNLTLCILFSFFRGLPGEPHIRASGGPLLGHFGTFSLHFLTNLKAKTQPKLPKQNPKKPREKKEIPCWELYKAHWGKCLHLSVSWLWTGGVAFRHFSASSVGECYPYMCGMWKKLVGAFKCYFPK